MRQESESGHLVRKLYKTHSEALHGNPINGRGSIHSKQHMGFRIPEVNVQVLTSKLLQSTIGKVELAGFATLIKTVTAHSSLVVLQR